MDMDLEQPIGFEQATLPQRRVLKLGVASLVLLVLCLLFAHHWNVVTVTLVTAWAACFLGALVGGLLLVSKNIGGPFVHLGLALTAVSVITLVIAGIAYAAGSDPTGGCGGV